MAEAPKQIAISWLLDHRQPAARILLTPGPLAGTAGMGGVDGGTAQTAPQPGHVSALPASESGLDIAPRHFGHVNSIMVWLLPRPSLTQDHRLRVGLKSENLAGMDLQDFKDKSVGLQRRRTGDGVAVLLRRGKLGVVIDRLSANRFQ